jgi:enediyne biosynthesis protein E4
VAINAGVAFSEDGKARAGMGVDVADYDNSGIPGLAITNFDNEMMGFYRGTRGGLYVDQASRSDVGRATRRSLGFGCFFFDADLDGLLDLLVVNGHIEPGIRDTRPDTEYAQPPHLFLNRGSAGFRDVAPLLGGGFADPKVGRGAAFGDFDRDGDLDVLITTNQGPAYLYRNDRANGHSAIRFRLIGTKSNRDAIGAAVRVTSGGETSSRMVKSGSSYLSQSELPVTFGLGRRDTVERAVLHWPSGRTEEYKNLRAGRTYECIEGKAIQDTGRF